MQQVAGHRVERAERLVHQQDVGVLGEGPGERDPLAHAAGQLVRPLVAEPVEVHRLEQRLARGPCARSLRARRAACSARSTLPATVSHGNSADSWNISAGAALDVDGAGGRLVEPGDQVEQGALAAARRADEADELAGPTLTSRCRSSAGTASLTAAVDLRHVAQRERPAEASGGAAATSRPARSSRAVALVSVESRPSTSGWPRSASTSLRSVRS